MASTSITRDVLNDIWDASAEKMKYLQQPLKQEFMMPLKANHKGAFSFADKRQEHFV